MKALLIFLFISLQAAASIHKEFSDFFLQEAKHKQILHPESKIPVFPLTYNEEIKKWIQFFSANKSFPSLWLTRSYRYLPLMKKILRSQKLPEELVYMTLIESSLSSSAVSPAQAVGYWQFIAPTARRFQLTVNEWLDERRDFEKSTRAAGRYLKILYQEFGSWLLSLSAYNMGEARLRKLTQKYKTKNFWVLARKTDFPRETAQYVPKIMAAILIMRSPESYGFTQFPVLEPYQYDLFYIPGGTDIKTLASKMNRSFEELKTLNPELKTHRIPKNIQNHKIRIPKGTASLLSAWLKNKEQP